MERAVMGGAVYRMAEMGLTEWDDTWNGLLCVGSHTPPSAMCSGTECPFALFLAHFWGAVGIVPVHGQWGEQGSGTAPRPVCGWWCSSMHCSWKVRLRAAQQEHGHEPAGVAPGSTPPEARATNKNCAGRGVGVGVGGGGWLSVDMSQGTCPQLAVTMWTWMQWMSACPCGCGPRASARGPGVDIIVTTLPMWGRGGGGGGAVEPGGSDDGMTITITISSGSSGKDDSVLQAILGIYQPLCNVLSCVQGWQVGSAVQRYMHGLID